MRVLICGDRNWTNRGRIRGVLQRLRVRHGQRLVIVHGANGYDETGAPSYASGRPTVRGADMLAHEEAQKLGIALEAHPADWKAHGKAAGPIRNAEMLATGPDVVLAFHDSYGTSKGTKDMLARAVAADVPAHVITNHVLPERADGAA